MPVRVLVADDDPLIREALEIILGRDPGFSLAASVDSGEAALGPCLRAEVDVALLDIRMPGMGGIEAAARIVSGSSCRVLLLSTFKDDSLVRGALASGASGYLLKGSGGEEIKQAIKLVASGHTVFHEDVFAAMREPGAQAHGDVSFLSPRERDIVKLVAEGNSNKQIAEAVFLSEGTVKNYISLILDKLGLRQRTQIAVYYATGKKDFT
jgi:DNA-binding NarL/FixJ family response regulator